MELDVPAEVKEALSFPQRFGRWVFDEVQWFVRVVLSASERFYWDNGLSKAASLAYTCLLSLIPVLTLGFGFLASFAVDKGYLDGMENFFIHQLVPAPEVAEQLRGFLKGVSQNVSALSVPMLLWFVIASILLINTIEYALNETWQVFEPRPWIQRVGTFSSMILITPVLALSAYVFVKLRLEPFILGMEDTWLHSLYNYLLPFFLVFAAFVCLYYLVPNAPVRLNSAIFGAFITSMVFLIAYVGFAVYIERYAQYDKLYGAIAAVPIFLFWLYIVWTIVLVGAEATYQAQYLPRKGKVWKRSVYSVGDGRMLLSMQALVIITRSFLNGDKMPDSLEISERLGCSSVVLKPALDALESAGIISRNDARNKLFTLMRSPDKITLSEIKEALFKGRKAMHYPQEMVNVYSAFIGDLGGREATLLDVVGIEQAL